MVKETREVSGMHQSFPDPLRLLILDYLDFPCPHALKRTRATLYSGGMPFVLGFTHSRDFKQPVWVASVADRNDWPRYRTLSRFYERELNTGFEDGEPCTFGPCDCFWHEKQAGLLWAQALAYLIPSREFPQGTTAMVARWERRHQTLVDAVG